jgi:hypothetical protein
VDAALLAVRHFGAVGGAATLAFARVLALAAIVARFTAAFAFTGVLAFTGVFLLYMLASFLGCLIGAAGVGRSAGCLRI